MPRVGHVALAGAPNAGKSSLLNRLIGADLAIVSPKAQTTRLPVTGLRSTDQAQLILHDLPGLLEPQYALHSRMLDAAREVLGKVHVILHLHPAPDYPAPAFWPLTGLEKFPEVPVLQVYTKADLLGAAARVRLGDALLVSSVDGAGIEALASRIEGHLPEADYQFDREDLGTQPVRFFAAEYVREGAFQELEQELPYALAVEVEEFREHTRPMYIRVTLLVERESQKGMVVGRGGRTLKAIGQHARARLEALVGQPVFLDCWVKVSHNWRRNPAALDRLGFPERG
jgi:GTP-binding protein Era